jgi:hypothetical protein
MDFEASPDFTRENPTMRVARPFAQGRPLSPRKLPSPFLFHEQGPPLHPAQWSEPILSAMSEPSEPLSEDEDNHPKVAEVVRLTILHAAQMQALTHRVEEIGERISKLTPPPEKPEAKE